MIGRLARRQGPPKIEKNRKNSGWGLGGPARRRRKNRKIENIQEHARLGLGLGRAANSGQDLLFAAIYFCLQLVTPIRS